MAKKLGKSEKLDLILSELSALRADLKSLLSSRPDGRARPTPAEKPAKRTEAPDTVAKSAKTAKTAKAPKPAKAAKAKPVLVETDDEDESPQPASRIA